VRSIIVIITTLSRPRGGPSDGFCVKHAYHDRFDWREVDADYSELHLWLNLGTALAQSYMNSSNAEYTRTA